MRRSIRFRSVTIALAPLLSIAGTTANGAKAACGVDMERIGSNVLGELDTLEANMGTTYQAILAMLKQSFEMRKDKLREAKVQNEQKLRVAQEATDARRR